MPSQEAYLDRLLNGVSEDEAKAGMEEAGAAAEPDVTGVLDAALEMDAEPGVQDAETSDDIGAEIFDGLDADALDNLDLGGLDVELPEGLDVGLPEGLDVELPEGLDIGIPESFDVEAPESLDVVPEEGLDAAGAEEFGDAAADGLDAETMAELDSLIAEGMDGPDVDVNFEEEGLDAATLGELDNLGIEELSEGIDAGAAEDGDKGVLENLDAEIPEDIDVMPEQDNLAAEGFDAGDVEGLESLDTMDMGDFDHLDLEALDNLGVDDLPAEDIELPEDFDMDALEENEDEAADMTEEEIEKLLEESSRVDEAEISQAEALADEDNLMELLQDAGDNDLQDIHDLLEKADNNEAVDEAVIARMQDEGDGQAFEAGDVAADAEETVLGAREQKAADKKKQKAEKAAAKKAAKEAKKAEKLAKAAAKKAGKGAAAAVGEEAGDSAPGTAQGAAEGGQGADAGAQEANEEEELGFDMAELDELLNFSADLNTEKPPKTDSPEEAEAVVDAGEALAEIAADAGGEELEKKKGLFARILDFLTEEDEEDEEESGKGTENVPMSDENKNIIKEMEQEGGKKGKKDKKPKKEKKGKKGKDAEGAEGEGAEGEDSKKKKPKKEKKPKEQIPVDPKNKITVKKIMPVALASLSILLMIFLLVYLGGDFMLKRNARKAFYAEDYGTCYQELYGKKLSKSEQVMFGKSESILRVRLWMREYELFAEEGADAQALDILIQSVNDYSALYNYASQWNAEGEVGAVYAQMLGILQSKYGLTEAQALQIAAEPDDFEYTLKVMDVVEGKGMDAEVFEPVNLPDMLPEERLFPENNGGR